MEELDEFGIPIKKAEVKKEPKLEVDEFGIPIKKKEPTTPPLSFGYKTVTEATSNAGLPKQETISQSPLKSTAKSTLPAACSVVPPKKPPKPSSARCFNC